MLIKELGSGILTTGECVRGKAVNLIGDQNVIKLSLGVIYLMRPKLEFSLDLIHVASGCNTAAGNTLIFGVAFKRLRMARLIHVTCCYFVYYLHPMLDFVG